MKSVVSRFLEDRSGATAIEYAIVACGIAVVLLAAISLVGTNLLPKYNDVATALK